MREFFRKLSLRSIIMIFCSSFILLVIVVAAVFYFTGVRHMNSLIRQNAANLTLQATQNLDRKLRQLKSSSSQTITESTLFLNMNKNMKENQPPISAKRYTELARNIQTFVNQNSQDISVVILMLSNNSIVLTASYYDEIYRCRQPDYEKLYSLYSNHSLDWVYRDTAEEFISNTRMVPEIGLIQMLGCEDSEIRGFLYVGIADQSVAKELTYYHVTNQNLFTLSRNGEILLHDPAYFAEDTYEKMRDEDLEKIRNAALETKENLVSMNLSESYALYSPMEIPSLAVLTVIPKEELFLDSNRFSTLVLAEAIGAVLICLLLFAVVTKFISAPAEKLAKQLNSMETLTQLENVQPTGGKDFVQITNAVNRLFNRIQDLIASLTAEIQSRKDAELRILYAQINPHFLYNTLDSIGQLCEMGEADAAYRMVHELSDFYRIGVSKGENLISLEEELLHVTSYLSILKTRFEDFEFSVDAPDALKDVQVPKIILQPLAENAVYHGIRGSQSNGVIRISVKESGEDIMITVTDDGMGMEEEILDGIRRSLEDSSAEEPTVKSYGIKNVHQRIRLQFGDGYGLTIKSEPEAGTEVIVKLPCMRRNLGGAVR